MKKFLLVCLIFILMSFTACSKVADVDSPKHASTSSDNVSKAFFSTYTSSLKKSDKPLTENEVKEIFEPLLSKAIIIQETILNDGSEYTILNHTPIIINENNYYLIEHSEFKTIDDIWEFAYTAYTKETAKRIFYNSLNPNGDFPRFIEIEGELYYYNGAHGYCVEYPIDTLEIVEQYEDIIIVSIDYCCYDYEPEKSVYIMCRTETGWRLCNSEYEAVYELPKHFLK